MQPNGITCLTGVSSPGRRRSVDLGSLNRELVLENNLVFGSVNANRSHWEAAARALGSADGDWLRRLVTPEMLSYFAEELSANASKGVINRVSDVKLLQGDLSEAWREDGAEYATVAMRYGLVDKFLDRSSGRLVEGSDQPQQATELWTFRRSPGGHWLLSAIQQT